AAREPLTRRAGRHCRGGSAPPTSPPTTTLFPTVQVLPVLRLALQVPVEPRDDRLHPQRPLWILQDVVILAVDLDEFDLLPEQLERRVHLLALARRHVRVRRAVQQEERR